MGFGSLGISELVVIFIIVLVFFGPRRFPEIARSMGSAMREFRRSLNQIQRELEEVDPRKDMPGRELLDDLRSMKSGKWLDPNETRVPESTPAARSAPAQESATPGAEEAGPEQTRESADPAQGSNEQLPMFEGEASPEGASPTEAEPRPEDRVRDDSRSD